MMSVRLVNTSRKYSEAGEPLDLLKDVKSTDHDGYEHISFQVAFYANEPVQHNAPGSQNSDQTVKLGSADQI